MTDESAGGGLRPIGNLATAIVTLRATRDSTSERSTEPPQSSATTGQPHPAEMPASSIGPRRGEAVSARSPSAVSLADPHHRDKSAEAWLRSRLNWQPNMRLKQFPDDGHGWDGCYVPRPPEVWTDEARESWADALHQIQRLCEPGGEAVVLAELAKLRVTMAHRNGGAVDERALLAVIAEDLAEYPADVVRAACTAWRRREKWFPTPGELIAECTGMVRRRYAMRNALLAGERRRVAAALWR